MKSVSYVQTQMLNRLLRTLFMAVSLLAVPALAWAEEAAEMVAKAALVLLMTPGLALFYE